MSYETPRLIDFIEQDFKAIGTPNLQGSLARLGGFIRARAADPNAWNEVRIGFANDWQARELQKWALNQGLSANIMPSAGLSYWPSHVWIAWGSRRSPILSNRIDAFLNDEAVLEFPKPPAPPQLAPGGHTDQSPPLDDDLGPPLGNPPPVRRTPWWIRWFGA